MKYNFNVMDLYDKFKEFNRAYFNNKLPLPSFKITKNKSNFGCFKYRPTGAHIYNIEISHFLDRCEMEINTTLIHEMIHLWQRVYLDEANHGKSFKDKAAEIKRLSDGLYDIHRCSPLMPDTEPVSQKIKPTILVTFDYKGKRYYAKPTRFGCQALLDLYKNDLHVTNMKTILAFGDFSRMRASVRRLNCEVLDDEKAFNKRYKVQKVD